MIARSLGRKIEEYVADYTVVDLETTGLDTSYDKIAEISAVRVRGGEVVDTFSMLVNPGVPMPAAAGAVNNITDDMLHSQPAIDEALPMFEKFIGDDVLVGHNIFGFDMQFLCREYGALYTRTLGNDYVDTLALARRHLPHLARHGLGCLAEHYGISTEGAHRALADCIMNAAVFEKLKEDMKSTPVEIPTCPDCGRQLRLRRGKFGEFWGCVRYPNCKYTRNV